MLDSHFGLYELGMYAVAHKVVEELKIERAWIVKTLYDDISPTITTVDYATGRWYSQTTHPEEMAIKIIEEKEKYDVLLAKEERKSMLFRLAMGILTDQERDVIQVYYLGRTNDLGLSPTYFNKLLYQAQEKLCIFLVNERKKFRKSNKQHYLTELAERISNC